MIDTPHNHPDTLCTGKTCAHKMRSRCTECSKEQYGTAIWNISHGIEPCVWCGKYNPVKEEAK